MVKDVNVSTANEFHIWQRANLPDSLVIQDLDTWSVAISDKERSYMPTSLIELKRSFYPVERWEPFKDDWPNYLSLMKLAQKASIQFFTVYFKKGEPISRVAWFEIHNVDPTASPWIEYNKEILTTDELKNKILSL